MFKPYKDKTSVDVIELKIPHILINKSAMYKMKILIDNCDDEVGWLGTAEDVGGIILIDDILLFDQEVHSTTTEITPEGLSEFGEEIIQKENGVDIWNSLRVWGHSHVHMSVSPSTQDDEQMKTFKDNGHDWFIRIIANKNGDMKVDYYNYELGIAYLDVKWEVLLSHEEERLVSMIDKLQEQLDEYNEKQLVLFEEPIKEEIKLKVKKKSTTWQYKTWGGNKKENKGSEDKKKVIPINSDENYYYNSYINPYDDYEQNNYFGLDYDVSTKVYTDKQIEEIKEENIEYGLFADYMVSEFLDCNDVNEMRDIITSYGYDDVYEDDELLQISMDLYSLYTIKDSESTIN